MPSCNNKIELYLSTYLGGDTIFSGYLIRRNGKIGVLDYHEKTLLSCDYDNIIVVQFDDLIGGSFYFRHNEDFDAIEQEVLPSGNKYAFLCNFAGKWGLLDENFSIIVPFEYEDIHILFFDPDWRDPGMCFAVKNDGKWGLFKNGHLVIACSYDGLECLGHENSKCFRILMNGQWGVTNDCGDIIVPCNYDDIHLRSNGIYVKSSRKMGLYQLDGTPAIPCLYDGINNNCPKDCAVVSLNGKYGLWVKRDYWRKYLSCEFDAIEPLCINLCDHGEPIIYPYIVTVNSKKGIYGLKNNEAVELVPIEFNRICKHREGYMLLIKDDYCVPLLEYLKEK